MYNSTKAKQNSHAVRRCTSHTTFGVSMEKVFGVTVSNDSQKWKGLFHWPFVLRNFAAHLLVIEGSVNVFGLHDTPAPAVVGALGLAAASVCIIQCA